MEQAANQYPSPDDTNAKLNIDQSVMFTNHKNIRKRCVEKRQKKLLSSISFIEPFLMEDEQVLLITTGCSPMSFLEQFLMGWIVFIVKRSVFVFTDKRFFHIPSTSSYKYRGSIAHAYYGDCQEICLKSHTLSVRYGDGNKEKFHYIASQERKKLKSLLWSSRLEKLQTEISARTHLCPRCTGELANEAYTCPTCNLEFKNKTQCRKLSLIYPGGGYFYTRHYYLAVGDAIVEYLFLHNIILCLIDAAKGVPGTLVSALVFAILLIFEKAVTIYDSNNFVEEYLPVKKDFMSEEYDEYVIEEKVG